MAVGDDLLLAGAIPDLQAVVSLVLGDLADQGGLAPSTRAEKVAG